MYLFDFILSITGLAKKSDIRNLQGNITKLKQKREVYRQEIQDVKKLLVMEKDKLSSLKADLKTLKDEKILFIKQQEWCNGIVLDFPPGTPKGLHQNTISYAKYFLKNKLASFNDLRRLGNFSTESQWALYWCLAHAADVALKDVDRKVEDGITNTFVRQLTYQVQQAKFKLPTTALPLQLAHCCIYEQCQPAMKESDVGADLLLIVAGAGLVADAGARLFWIQAKKSNDDPFNLNCRYKNKHGLQIDALLSVNKPQYGSFSLYLQYAEKLAYIPSVWLEVAVPPEGKNNIDLSLHGLRCQELIAALTAVKSDKIGVFSNTSEIIKFLNLSSEVKPLYVVIAADGSTMGLERWESKSMLTDIVDYYQKEFGLKMSPERTQEKDQEKGWDMER